MLLLLDCLSYRLGEEKVGHNFYRGRSLYIWLQGFRMFLQKIIIWFIYCVVRAYDGRSWSSVMTVIKPPLYLLHIFQAQPGTGRITSQWPKLKPLIKYSRRKWLVSLQGCSHGNKFSKLLNIMWTLIFMFLLLYIWITECGHRIKPVVKLWVWFF